MKKLKVTIAIGAILLGTLQFEAEARPRPGSRDTTRQTRQVDSSSRQRDRASGERTVPSDTERPGKFQDAERPTASPQQQANIAKLQQDLLTLKSESEVTQAQKDQLATDLRNLAQGTQKPSQESVDKLAHDLSEAVADGNLTKMEQAQLAQDVAAVMNSANIPPEEVEAALQSAEAILQSSNIDQSDVALIMADLEAIAREMQSNLP